jgi:uncharacterized membrane protein YdjX (TVP38/TMEM64 family)
MTAGVLRSYKFWIAITAMTVVIAVRVSPIGQLISLDTLRVYHVSLTEWVAANAVLAAVGYVAIYIAATALSFPGGAMLSLTGGFLFGPVFGTALISVGATIGATIVFLFARTLFGDQALAKIGEQQPQLVAGIRRNAWSYLLVMRLIPLFPFFLVNLVPAFVGVSLPTYLVTTFFGILPGSAVYSLSGAGLGDVLDRGSDLSVGSVFTPTIIAALVGLSVLSLLALAVRSRFERKSADPEAKPYK